MQLNAYETSGISPGKQHEASEPTKDSHPTIEPRLLTVKDAARYLNTTMSFVRSLIWSGFPHLRRGKRLLLDRADLDLYVERQKTEAL